MGGEGIVEGGQEGGGRKEMPVVGVHDSFLKNSSQKKKKRWRWTTQIIQIRIL